MAIFLGKHREFDYYGTISKKIYDRFDKSKILYFCFKKSIIHYKHVVNAIKFIKKNTVKVKYDSAGDHLLILTSILYSNEQGKLLLNMMSTVIMMK